MAFISPPTPTDTTGTQIQGAMQGLLAPQDATGVANVNTIFTKKRYKFLLPLATATSSTAFEIPIDINDFNMNVTSVKYFPAATLTSDSTNYQTIALEKGDLAAGTRTAIASVATTPAGSGSWSALVPVTIPITAANAFVSANASLMVKATVSGSGVVIPAGVLIVEGYIV